jgi:hypothetical protein
MRKNCTFSNIKQNLKVFFVSIILHLIPLSLNIEAAYVHRLCLGAVGGGGGVVLEILPWALDISLYSMYYFSMVNLFANKSMVDPYLKF